MCMQEMEVEGTVITIPHISIRYISENADQKLTVTYLNCKMEAWSASYLLVGYKS